MKRFIKYPSIEQFRIIIKNVRHSAQYAGYNEETQSPIFDYSLEFPKIKVIGTEKIHGTNASVCYSNPDGFWVQKRTSICTPESDNAGCAFVAMQNEDAWKDIIFSLAEEHNIDLDKNIISVFYEWCGGNIQKNSAVSNLDKMAIIFRHFKVSPIEPDETYSEWKETSVNGHWIDCPEARIWNISNFPTYEFEIDFSNPEKSQNNLIKTVEEVIEPSSPVGKTFGQESNIGEGLVCSFIYKDSLNMFKVKGDAHANNVGLRGLDVDRITQGKILRFLKENNSKTFSFSFSTIP